MQSLKKEIPLQYDPLTKVAPDYKFSSVQAPESAH